MTTRFAVDPWDPSYGTPTSEQTMEESTASLNLDLEVPACDWAPVDATGRSWEPSEVLVVDGIRRIDARVWFLTDTYPAPAPGIAASYAAGVVRINGRATIADAAIRRNIFTACPSAEDVRTPLAHYPIVHTAGGDPDALSLALQQQMRDLELVLAHNARTSDDDLLILDGPLRGRTTVPRTVGYIKTHHASYLPADMNRVVADLQPGQRTPVFTIGTTWSRHTWYLRLPVDSAAPWAGVVRCECADGLSRDDAVRLADTTTALLPALASLPHKDPRAPQNLIPIGGLEKQLRHRLGDATKLHRTLVSATRRATTSRGA